MLNMDKLFCILVLLFTVNGLRIPTKAGSDVLDNFPLIDGHNDLPMNIVDKLQNRLSEFEFSKNLTEDPIFGTAVCSNCMTDLVRLKTGKVGAQFWVAYVGCDAQYKDGVSKALDQVDVIKRLIRKYPNDLELVTTADGIIDAFNNRKIASLIAVEGGHHIGYRMGNLRLFYELGARYMTLTHSCNTPWADASPVDQGEFPQPVHNLTEFGKKIVLEMNRLGMMVDLSHVSHNVMSDALDVSVAPVIFSHSSAYAIFNHARNVRDDILERIPANGGIVMVNFYKRFLGDGVVDVSVVAEHINHIVNIAGIDHVGIGSDFDGIDEIPIGLEDTSKYPNLFDYLQENDPEMWTMENLEKLAGRNFYRVFKEVEQVRDNMINGLPDETWIDVEDLAAVDDIALTQCTTPNKK